MKTIDNTARTLNLIWWGVTLLFFVFLFYYMINLAIALKQIEFETVIIDKGLQAYEAFKQNTVITWYDRCPDYYMQFQRPCSTNESFRNLTGCYCNNELIYQNSYKIENITFGK